MSQSLGLSVVGLALALGVGTAVFGPVERARAEPPPRVAAPASHANLAVYMLRGPSAPGPVPLTLAEALAKDRVTVHETGAVNSLEIENRGDQEVFIQAGDIVKGGQQDRALTISLLLPPGAGRLPIGAFCVEQGRWASRGGEDVKRFASADKAVPSREAKLAMLRPAKPQAAPSSDNPGAVGAPAQQAARMRPQGLDPEAADTIRRQSEVWASVGKIQQQLSRNLNARVSSGVSQTSLQLSLESEALVTARTAYHEALGKAGDGEGDIVGVAFVINGRLSSAELYPSNGLFRKMWPKLLDASIAEAIGQRGEAVQPAPASDKVAELLAAADNGKSEAETASLKGFRRKALESETHLAIATLRADGTQIHRTYLAK